MRLCRTEMQVRACDAVNPKGFFVFSGFSGFFFFGCGFLLGVFVVWGGGVWAGCFGWGFGGVCFYLFCVGFVGWDFCGWGLGVVFWWWGWCFFVVFVGGFFVFLCLFVLLRSFFCLGGSVWVLFMVFIGVVSLGVCVWWVFFSFCFFGVVGGLWGFLLCGGVFVFWFGLVFVLFFFLFGGGWVA